MLLTSLLRAILKMIAMELEWSSRKLKGNHHAITIATSGPTAANPTPPSSTIVSSTSLRQLQPDLIPKKDRREELQRRSLIRSWQLGTLCSASMTKKSLTTIRTLARLKVRVR